MIGGNFRCMVPFLMVLCFLLGCEVQSSHEWISERYDLDEASCVVGEGQSRFVFFASEEGVKYVHLIETGKVGSDRLRSVYTVEFNEFSDNPVPLSGVPDVKRHDTVEIGRKVFSYIESFYPLDLESADDGLVAVVSVSLGVSESDSPAMSTYESFEFDYVVSCELPALRLN